MQTACQERNRLENLVNEVSRGEHRKDVLRNSSLDFAEEGQALYFSNMRKSMTSVIAHTIMTQNQRLDDLKVLEVLNGNE